MEGAFGKEFPDDEEEARDRVKGIFYEILFSDWNAPYCKYGGSPVKIFKEKYRVPAKVIELLQSRHYKDFSMLLQRIESHLIINVICKRITKERPSLFISTIHDCIVTLEGEEKYVQRVMEEELYKFVGYPAKVKTKAWNPAPEYLAYLKTNSFNNNFNKTENSNYHDEI